MDSRYGESQSWDRDALLDSVEEGVTEGEDPVTVRLRKYATLKPISQRKGQALRILSHWRIGSDPSEVTWKPLDTKSEDDKELQAKRKREEARRKKEEKRQSRAAESKSPSVQPLHHTFLSSQVQEVSQSQSSSLGQPSQPMSQVVPGPYGSRRPAAKGKRKGRMAGFR